MKAVLIFVFALFVGLAKSSPHKLHKSRVFKQHHLVAKIEPTKAEIINDAEKAIQDIGKAAEEAGIFLDGAHTPEEIKTHLASTKGKIDEKKKANKERLGKLAKLLFVDFLKGTPEGCTDQDLAQGTENECVVKKLPVFITQLVRSRDQMPAPPEIGSDGPQMGTDISAGISTESDADSGVSNSEGTSKRGGPSSGISGESDGISKESGADSEVSNSEGTSKRGGPSSGISGESDGISTESGANSGVSNSEGTSKRGGPSSGISGESDGISTESGADSRVSNSEGTSKRGGPSSGISGESDGISTESDGGKSDSSIGDASKRAEQERFDIEDCKEAFADLKKKVEGRRDDFIEDLSTAFVCTGNKFASFESRGQTPLEKLMNLVTAVVESDELALKLIGGIDQLQKDMDQVLVSKKEQHAEEVLKLLARLVEELA